MTGISTKLAGSADTDVSSVSIDGRSTGTHGDSFTAIFQLDILQSIFINNTIFIYGHPIEISALGCEIVGVCPLLSHNVASNIPGVRKRDLADHSSRLRIQRKKTGMSGRIACFTIIGSNQDKIIRYISSCPVETALLRIGPGSFLLFLGGRRIFIRHRQAYKIRTLHFWPPETGINISILIDNRTVRLTAQFIMVDPQRFQRIRIKRLDTAIRQPHEDHAVRIGRRINGKAGSMIHGSAGFHFSRHFVHFIDLVFCVSINIIPYQNRTSACIGIVSFS